jgi:hypothetical protein
LLLPLVLLHDYQGAGLVADDLHFSTTDIDLSASRLFGSEWGHPVVPGTVGYRPLVLLSYAFDQRLSGRDPAGYRLTNYVVHGAVCVAMALLVSSIVRSRAAGLFAGVLFAVHPIHHENVLWISGRTHTLAALFVLTALWWVWTSGTRSRARQDVIGAVLFALALGAYESAAVLPVALLPVVALRAGERGGRTAAALRDLLPFAVVLVAYLLFRWAVLTSAASDLNAYTTDRPFRNALAVSARLLTVTRETAWPAWTPVVTTLVTLLALFAAWSHRRLRATLLIGLAIGVVFYLPFVAAERYVDRFAYLTSAGFVMVLTAGVVASLPRGSPRPGDRGVVSLGGSEEAGQADSPARGHRVGRVGLVLVVCLMVVLWTAELRRAGQEWFEAGELVETIVQQLLDLEPDPAPHATMTFFRIPATHGQAWVYLTYFEHEVRRRYGRELRVVNHPDPGDDAIAAAIEAAGAGGYVFWWDRAERRLNRATR